MSAAPIRDWPGSPVTNPVFDAVDASGTRWRCSTNGHALAARRVSDADAQPTGSVSRVEVVRTALAAATRDVDLAMLRSGIGAVEWPKEITCRECRGSGRAWNADGDCGCANCACDRCDGEGKEETTPAERCVRIDGRLFNANLIAQALDLLGPVSGEARGGFDRDGDRAALVIRGSDWIVVVMTMTDVGNVYPAIEVFR